jgi:hypothetical protein
LAAAASLAVLTSMEFSGTPQAVTASIGSTRSHDFRGLTTDTLAYPPLTIESSAVGGVHLRNLEYFLGPFLGVNFINDFRYLNQ